MVGDDQCHDMTAAEIGQAVGIVATTALRAGSALFLIVFVEGHDDGGIAWLAPNLRICDLVDQHADLGIAAAHQTLIIGAVGPGCGGIALAPSVHVVALVWHDMGVVRQLICRQVRIQLPKADQMFRELWIGLLIDVFE